MIRYPTYLFTAMMFIIALTTVATAIFMFTEAAFIPGLVILAIAYIPYRFGMGLINIYYGKNAFLGKNAK
jgi:hypothetical protein